MFRLRITSEATTPLFCQTSIVSTNYTQLTIILELLYSDESTHHMVHCSTVSSVCLFIIYSNEYNYNCNRLLLTSNRLLCLVAIGLYFSCYKLLLFVIDYYLFSLSKFVSIDMHSQIMKRQLRLSI